MCSTFFINIKYVVERPELDQENLNIFRKYCSWNPCLFYFIVNLFVFLLLVALGFAVAIGISSACKFFKREK
jgi:hypothetical protein